MLTRRIHQHRSLMAKGPSRNAILDCMLRPMNRIEELRSRRPIRLCVARVTPLSSDPLVLQRAGRSAVRVLSMTR
jgi:hypothetical protein